MNLSHVVITLDGRSIRNFLSLLLLVRMNLHDIQLNIRSTGRRAPFTRQPIYVSQRKENTKDLLLTK